MVRTSNFTPHTSHSAEGQLREIPHYSSILSFHHSAPNKPNFGPGRRKDKCRVDKELWRMGHGRGREKTKPIWRSDKAGRGGGRDTGRSRPGRPRYSWALAPMLRDALRRLPACAGMTLLRTGVLRQTNPISERVISRTSAVPTRTCNASDAGRAPTKQSQFPEAGHRGGVSIADCGSSRTGSPACAMLSLACMGRLYKQTQFPPLCRSGDRRSQGPIVRNKANSRTSGRADGTGNRHRMPATPLPTTPGSTACQAGRRAVS